MLSPVFSKPYCTLFTLSWKKVIKVLMVTYFVEDIEKRRRQRQRRNRDDKRMARRIEEEERKKFGICKCEPIRVRI